MPNYMTVLLDGVYVNCREDGEIYRLDGKFYLVQEEWNEALGLGQIVTLLGEKDVDVCSEGNSPA